MDQTLNSVKYTRGTETFRGMLHLWQAERIENANSPKLVYNEKNFQRHTRSFGARYNFLIIYNED